MLTPADLEVSSLGPCKVRSPLPLSTVHGDGVGDFVPDDTRVLSKIEFRTGERIHESATDDQGVECSAELSFERAGARQWIYFDPPQTRAAIVTCGGLCPGLNNVIRSAFFQLHSNYGVAEVLGIRYGFEGLNPRVALPPVRLTGEFVEDIHNLGGTALGTSRGEHGLDVMVDYLAEHKINILLCVGGDGTQRGAHELAVAARRRQLPLAVVGIPKTIDNDIAFVSHSFGFNTALEQAKEHISCAHNEAKGARNGVGLVKLMGRHAGFIAAGATLASAQVNFALIPEVPFELDGDCGLLAKLERRLLARQHAVIVVAEGAGQHWLDCSGERDASGNKKLADIGLYLKERIQCYLRDRGVPVSVKYFDPSYHIRSVPANCDDALLCNRLAARAVHAAMAGKTDMLIGLVHDHFVHVPLPAVIAAEKRVSPESDLWMDVLAATGQDKW